MKRGDVVLISYKLDPLGWLISLFIRCKFNHVAWVVTDDGVLIEANKRTIALNNIKHYRNKWLYSIKIGRLIGVSDAHLNDAFYFAFQQLGKCSVRVWLISAICVWLRLHPRRLLCSTLVATSLAKVGFVFNNKKSPDNITPYDIYNSLCLYDVTKEYGGKYEI